MNDRIDNGTLLLYYLGWRWCAQGGPPSCVIPDQRWCAEETVRTSRECEECAEQRLSLGISPRVLSTLCSDDQHC